MKRRDRLPLFRSIEPDVYLVDTSAWLNIDSRTDAEDVWRIVAALIDQGRLFACTQVLGELRDDPIYLARIKPHERALQAGDRNGDDPDYLQHVGRITHDYPGMCKPTGRKTPADPYVVALAQLDNYVIVADETMRRRPTRKIPGVCQQLGVRCMTLAQFISVAKKEVK